MIFRRFFTTCFAVYNQSSAREARFLMKMLKKYPSKRNSTKSLVAEYVTGLEPTSKGNRKRLSILNKLFMKYVTDILATGNISSDIIGRGIEVSRVSVTPDYGFLQVFWISKNTNSDPDIEVLLNNVAHKLHHELSQLRLIGKVPKIIFVKDIFQIKLKEVEDILGKVNFDVVTKEIEDEGVSNKIEDEGVSNKIETMPMNVYGLYHDKIMLKVRNLKNRQKAVHRSICSIPESNENSKNEYQLSTKRSSLMSYITKKNKNI